MAKNKTIAIVLFVTLLLVASAASAKPASVLLQEALYAEEVEGNVDAAIKTYQQVIDDSSAQRPHIAQAMYRQGMCYLKKQDEASARVIFEALATNYSDQTNIIEKVKPLLDELSNPDPAMLMPPNTLVYWETGSPGKQIETILNMLKGTPFENPLAVIGKGQGGKSPSDIVAALMNPSMMAEFKKIRGMAVGVTGIAQSNPPSIAVLYPGKSDALRGIILAGLGMIAQPGDPIEGMQTLRFAEAGVAHDDRVIIIAQPIEQLTWCIKQYKGITKAPAFATNNKSFTKISRQARQDSAITIWANVDEVYKSILQMVPSDDLPSELKIAQQVGDFENIDDVLVTMGLRKQGLAVDATVSFKAGHSCMVYDLIRSPNLTGSGFKTLPPQAVAIASFALGDADSSGVAQAQKTVKRLTGLDIGREIFANIEQVTLFALPPQTSTGGADVAVPAPYCLGLALTSRNPEQTRQLCHQLLGIVDTLANSWANKSPNAKSDPAAGKFLIPIPNQEVYVHVKQAGKATVVAFSPNVLEASLAAVNKAGAPAASPLAEPLGNLSGSTSKLVLVNLGGAIRIFDSHIDFEHKNPQNPAHKLMGQLAQACEKTYVQLRTDEAVDNFSVHVSVNQLPPLDAVFPLLMQLMNTDFTAQAVATKPSPADGATIAPTQELKVDFRAGVNAKSHNVYFGTTADSLTMQTQAANKPDMKVLPLNITVSNPAEIKLPELEEGATYYWRVDEVWQDGTVITGQTWKFSVGKLVAHWKLDESEGSVAKDSAGGNNGTLVGNPQWCPMGGRVGGALQFDGDSDYVEASNESAFDLAGPISVTAWVKVNQFDKGWQAIVTKGDRSWRLQRHQQTNCLEFACTGLNVANDTQLGSLYGQKSINGGQWHHAAGVYDGQRMSLYVDGTLDVSVRAWGSLNADDYPVVIGENAQTQVLQKRSWNGLIDDVRIYNYALSEKEITALVSP